MSTKQLKYNALRLKSLTTNGRLSRIIVVKLCIDNIPSVVLVNRILAKQSDIDANYFPGFIVIKRYKHYLLLENTLGFKDTSFDKIVECVSYLRINYNG